MTSYRKCYRLRVYKKGGNKLYTLYHDKSNYSLKVEKAKAIFARSPLLFSDEVTVYNHNYYFCKNRKPLAQKAEGIKADWVASLEYQLHKAKNIKI